MPFPAVFAVCMLFGYLTDYFFSALIGQSWQRGSLILPNFSLSFSFLFYRIPEVMKVEQLIVASFVLVAVFIQKGTTSSESGKWMASSNTGLKIFVLAEGQNKYFNIRTFRSNLNAWPNACNISSQHLATLLHDVAMQHCCMMLRQLLNGLAKRTQHSSHVAVYEPQASGTRM